MKKKILIVDDEQNIIYALRLLLEKVGYEVVSCENGNQAIIKYEEFLPDVVLLDIMMPEMDGFETAYHLRKMDSQSKAKIIFLTAKGTMEDKMTAYSKGGDDYVIKPFDNEYLLEKIKQCF